VRCRRTTEQAAPAPRRLERKLRLLVAEPHCVHARILSSYLTSWGLEPVFVKTAEDARETWKRAAERGQNFDAAILDLKGLAERGVALGREMRAGPTEVVFLIGMDRSAAEKSLENVDAAAILAKPVRPSDLFNSLAAIASDSQARGVAPFYVSHNALGKNIHFNARILVAEDNPVNQDVATGILENMGCRVVTASNGAIAMRLMTQEHFDLVLMDCEMPEMDGFDATRCIRQYERAQPDGKRTPIVALTAHALAEIRKKCLEAGMDDFLTKPYDENQMGDALHRWIGRLACAPGKVAHPAAAPDDCPISRDVLDNVSAFKGANGQVLFKRVVSRFAGTAPDLAASLREKFDAGNAEELWRIAHSLKSSASALGANRLAHRAGEIEVCAREQGLPSVQPLLAGLEQELAAALKSLAVMTGESDEPAVQRG